MFCWYYYSDYFFRVPLTTYFLLAILTIATMGLSNTSLGYLNYPTQVIFKSSKKLIPVMIGGVFIQGNFLIFFHYFICIYFVYFFDGFVYLWSFIV